MSDLAPFVATLTDRSGGRCELCGATDDLEPRAVPPAPEPSADACVLACATCRGQLDGADLDDKHLMCLNEAAWSEVPAVQVVSWRLLRRLTGETWAVDLLGQLYMPDDVLAWAESGAEPRVRTVDSNGTELLDGDAVTLIKDLDVKGAGFTAKRGTLVKNIRLTDDPELVEGRVNKVGIVLKTCFLKRS